MDPIKIHVSPKKLYFVYFIIFTVIVIVVISYLLIGYYWKQWKFSNFLDNYYKTQAQDAAKKVPSVFRFDPIKGKADAKVTLYIYTDFTCANCLAVKTTIDSITKLYTDQIRYVFKGLPLTINAETRPSLSAAYCAWEQAKFWEYQDILFQNQANFGQPLYLQAATTLGLDQVKFQDCLTTNKYGAVLDRNLTEAVNMEVASVPTLFVNDQKIEGFINYYTLKNIIDAKLKQQ